MPVAPQYARVAVPAPVRQAFDYLIPADITQLAPGMRVRVPFGPRRSAVGVVLEITEISEASGRRLKAIADVLENEPLIPPPLLRLLVWSADYYHHPIGEVIAAALPTKLRRGEASSVAGARVWTLTVRGSALDTTALARARVRQRLWQALKAAPDGMSESDLAALTPRWRDAIQNFLKNGWVTSHQRDCLEAQAHAAVTPPALSQAQADAVEAIVAADGFVPFLLHGITGSGKTEVYLRAIEQVLGKDQQALVLVPEISLTPQLAARFRSRFDVPIAILHSNLNDSERACAWTMARAGKAPIVVGTRSAVYTPLPRLGLIIVDEEHDASFKQQDGFRYSARDVAIMRASQESVPIVLGSATPSLETLQRVRAGAYKRLMLPQRAGGAALPSVELLDLRKLSIDEGMSPPLRSALAHNLERGEQSLLFLNRRGFAPVWMCYGCGWIAPCQRCDARLTFHRGSMHLRCHHCGAEAELPTHCPSCKGAELHALGEGTERIEGVLKRWFPSARVVRVDRDSMRAKGALETTLERVRKGEADILIGTQMLSKGHDFPNVTLVGVLNADQGLYNSDFRSAERLVQQIVQVSGRAGRATKAGRVLIQTYHPDHPVLMALMDQNYDAFADYAMEERRATGFPPFTYLTLLRAEAPAAAAALGFLHKARALVEPDTGIELMDPVPSPMERRAGRYRAQMLVLASKRGPLHNFLAAWIARIAELKEARRVRWSVDVDPIDLY